MWSTASPPIGSEPCSTCHCSRMPGVPGRRRREGLLASGRARAGPPLPDGRSSASGNRRRPTRCRRGRGRRSDGRGDRLPGAAARSARGAHRGGSRTIREFAALRRDLARPDAADLPGSPGARPCASSRSQAGRTARGDQPFRYQRREHGLAALAPDHGRAVALPVLRRHRRPPRRAHDRAGARRTSSGARPRSWCSAPTLPARRALSARRGHPPARGARDGATRAVG